MPRPPRPRGHILLGGDARGRHSKLDMYPSRRPHRGETIEDDGARRSGMSASGDHDPIHIDTGLTRF
jgi:hypothetical protein